MRLTERARRDLERYLEEVRSSLTGHVDVDADDVVDGIREHVETALAHRQQDPVTAEDLADVLDRLGSPPQWAEMAGGGEPAPREAPPGREEAGSEARPERRAAPFPRPAAELAPLVLVAVGGTLVLTELTPLLGWALLVVGAITARLVVGQPAFRGRRATLSAALVSLIWHVAATVAFATLLLLPALLIWSQAQTGGALEPFLFERTLPPGGSRIPGQRPEGFWPLVALIAGLATGGWWIVVGLLARRGREIPRRWLGPASYLVSNGAVRGILLGGGFLFTISTVVLVAAVG